jgi:predicted DCC family thiol-disulfide oxidoreductase YuxK
MLGGLPLLMSLVSHDSGFLSIVSGLGRVQMAFGLVFPVLALIPAARFEAWVIAIALIAARALLGDGPIVHPFTFEWPGVVLLYVFAFDPGWIRPRGGDAPELIFYDGHCALCHRSVRFVLAEDQREVFQFAPLQSHVFEKAFPESVREPLPDSVVVLTHDGSPRTLSSATIHILLRLGGAWGVVGRLLWLIPRPARDMGYRLIAAIRFEVFGRRDDVCPVIPERLRERFTWD